MSKNSTVQRSQACIEAILAYVLGALVLVVTHAMLRRLISWRCIIIMFILQSKFAVLQWWQIGQ